MKKSQTEMYRPIAFILTTINMKAMKEYAQPVVSGNYYWVKLMTDDKHEPAMAINLLGVMNFQFFNGVVVPCDKVNDYSECNYIF